MEMAENKF